MVKFFSSLRLRLLLLVLLVFAISIGVVIYAASQEQTLAIGRAKANTLRMAKVAANSENQAIENSYNFLLLLSQLPAVRNHDPAVCNSFLVKLHMQYQQYKTFGVADRDGNIICSSFPGSKPTNLSSEPFFSRVLKTRDFATGEFRIENQGGGFLLAFGYPLLDEAEEFHGVVFTILDLEWLDQFVVQSLLPEGYTLITTNRNGTILTRYPDLEKELGQLIPTASSIEEILNQQGDGIIEAVGEDNIPHIYAFSSLNAMTENPIYIGVDRPTAAAIAEINQILTHQLTVLGVVAAIMIVSIWISLNYFYFRRVNALLDVTRRMTDGDLSARTKLPYGTGELSELAKSFDKMANTIQQRETDRMQAAEQISRQAARAETLAKMARNFTIHLDLQVALHTVCEEISKVLNASAACIRLYDEKKDILYLAAEYGLPPEFNQLVPTVPREYYDDIPLRSDTVAIVPDLRILSTEQPSSDSPYLAMDICTIVGAKMQHENQLVGYLSVFTFGHEREFSEDEKELLKGLADQAALAVINARLYTALQAEEHSRVRLLDHVITAQEDERMRIARELHDETSQSLTAIIVGLDLIRLGLQDQAPDVDERLQNIKSVAERMLKDVRRLISDLRPSLLDDLGLVPALEWYGEQCLRPMKIAFNFDAEGLQVRLPPAVETTLFRIAQEALTNVVRHTSASEVHVFLAHKGHCITMRVEDNGQGFDLAMQMDASQDGGFGLRGIQERVKILEGNVLLESTPGQGTMITVEIPLLLQGDALHIQQLRPIG
jgi:signal transduction histidine kinase